MISYVHMKTDTSCKEQLKARYGDAIADMKRLLHSKDWEQDFNQEVLSWEYNHQFKSLLLLLSWGGPADGFLFSPAGKKVKYYFQDWGDYAEKALTGKDLEIMQRLFEKLGEPQY